MANHAFEQSGFQTAALKTEELRGSWMSDLASPAVLRGTDNAKVLKVQAQAPEADDQQQGQGKSPVDMIRAADPKELGPGLKAMQGLAETFENSPDKAKALTQLKSGMDGAVKQTDDDFEAAKKTFETERNQLKPQIEPKMQALQTAKGNFESKFAKVPADDQERTLGLLQLYDNPKNSPALKKAIEGEMQKYPGLMPAAKGFMKAEAELAPFMEKAQKIKTALEEAGAERIGARMAYGQMAAEGGDEAKAHRMEMEARALIMGIPLDKVDELEKRLKQQKGN